MTSDDMEAALTRPDALPCINGASFRSEDRSGDEVLDVWEPTLRKQAGNRLQSGYHLTGRIVEMVRERQVQIAGKSYRLLCVEDIDTLLASLPNDADLPYWAILWESAIALAEWLIEQPDLIRGRRVLEVGTGLGLCGLVAAELGATITQTDHDCTALALAMENARLNGLEPLPQFQADWRQWSPPTRYEVILGSDVLYDRTVHRDLLSLFEAALGPDGVLLLSDPWRDAGWEFADLLLQTGWRVEVQSRIVDWDGRNTEIVMMTVRRR